MGSAQVFNCCYKCCACRLRATCLIISLPEPPFANKNRKTSELKQAPAVTAPCSSLQQPFPSSLSVVTEGHKDQSFEMLAIRLLEIDRVYLDVRVQTYPRKLQHTPRAHSGPSPVRQLWKESLYSPLCKGCSGCVPKVCWNNLRIYQISGQRVKDSKRHRTWINSWKKGWESHLRALGSLFFLVGEIINSSYYSS